MKDLLTAITTTLRTVTDMVHFDSLPDETYFNNLSIVFTLTNTANDGAIENTELVKNWLCEVRINSAKTTKVTGNNESLRIMNLIDPVKKAMYSINAPFMKCINQNFFFDSNNMVWTAYQRFEIITS